MYVLTKAMAKSRLQLKRTYEACSMQARPMMEIVRNCEDTI